VNVPDASVWLGERRLHLTPKAFAVLHYLVDHAGALITKDELLRAAWGNTVVSDAALTTCVREIRRRFGERAGAPRYIETMHRRGYRWIGPLASAAPAPREATRPAQPPPAPSLLVGRAAEMELLHGSFEQARKGRRQILFVTGEAGIGKTTLIDGCLGQIETTQTILSARGQCIEHYGAGEPYLPILEALARLCRPPRRRQVVRLLRQYAPTWLVQLPWLLRPAARSALQKEAVPDTQERMLREMAEALEALTAETPLVIVLEDLHWSDAATLDLLSSLARRKESARLLLIGTYRPVEVLARDHGLVGLVQDLRLQGRCSELPLDGLSEAETTAYVAECLPGHALPSTFARMLHQRTEGNPLFLVNVVRALVDEGVLVQGPIGWELAGDLKAVEHNVPENLRQMIERHGAQLSPEDQRVLEAASVAGVEFTAAAVAAGLGLAEEDVEVRCTALARHQHFLASRGRSEWPDGTVTARYGFLHALYQDAWYARVPGKRRIDLHRTIGDRLEMGHGTESGAIAAALAVHFAQGRDHARAVRYLRQAADNAVQRHAYAEARSLLTQALELLRHLPDAPARWRHELDLQLRLSPVLMATKGYAAPEVEATLTRALALSGQIGDARHQIQEALALAGFYLFRGDLQRARACAAQGLELSEQTQRRSALLWSHYMLGVILLMLGEFAAARSHLAEAASLHDPQSPPTATFRGVDDPVVRSHVDGGLALWCLGYPDQALHESHAGLDRAQRLAYPLSLASAWHLGGMLHQLRGEHAVTKKYADALAAVSTAHVISPLRAAGGLMLRGWAIAAQGDHDEGLKNIRQGLTLWESAGSRVLRPYALATLATLCLQSRRSDHGLSLLQEALALVNTTGERWYEAELYRLQGELTLAQSGGRDREAQVEATWRHALDIARRQQARSWELRAAMSLARLWQRQGRPQEAHDLLAPIYGWFTEGHATADLQQAKDLLTAPS